MYTPLKLVRLQTNKLGANILDHQKIQRGLRESEGLEDKWWTEKSYVIESEECEKCGVLQYAYTKAHKTLIPKLKTNQWINQHIMKYFSYNHRLG